MISPNNRRVTICSIFFVGIKMWLRKSFHIGWQFLFNLQLNEVLDATNILPAVLRTYLVTYKDYAATGIFLRLEYVKEDNTAGFFHLKLRFCCSAYSIPPEIW